MMFNTPHWPAIVSVSIEQSRGAWLARVWNVADFDPATAKADDDVREVELLRIGGASLDEAVAEVDRVLAAEAFTPWRDGWLLERDGPFGPGSIGVFIRAAVN